MLRLSAKVKWNQAKKINLTGTQVTADAALQKALAKCKTDEWDGNAKK
jgi:hypothetical protein